MGLMFATCGLRGAGWYAGVLVGQILIADLWNLVIYGKGLQHQIFLDNRTFFSGKVLVFKFWSYPTQSFGSMGPGEILVLGVTKGQSLSCECLGCMICSFGLLSLKCNSVSCQKQERTILSWFCFYIWYVEDLYLFFLMFTYPIFLNTGTNQM